MSRNGTLPVVAIDGNLIARTWDDVWAVFALQSRSYRSEPQRRQQALVAGLTNYGLNAGADFQILRVSRRFDAAAYAQRLRDGMPARAHRTLYHRYVSEQREQLERLQAWRPSAFLAVRLADPSVDLQGQASRLFERSRADVWRSLRRRPLLADVGDRAQVAQERVTDRLEARAATRAEICWLISRSFIRGITEPDPHVDDWAEPQRTDRLFAEDAVDPQDRYVRIVGEHGESFQAGLCLGEMGQALPFSRQVELMFTAIEEHAFPVDACLSVRWIPNDQAVRLVTRRVARTDNELRDEEQTAHGARDEGRRRAQLSDELHSRLTDSGEPLLMGVLSFMVPATSIEELRTRVRAVKEKFPWPLRRPFGDQLDVWLQHLPGQAPRVQHFERPFTCEQVGAMVPQATHEAGSDSGWYIAHSLHGHKPMFLDLREASKTDRPPTIAFEASLGGGKSMGMQTLYYQAFIQGWPIVDIDAKGDHRFHLVPEVARHTQTIEFGPNPEHRGKLDPLRIAPDNERQDSAVTFLVSILPRITGRDETLIHGAVGRVLDRHGPRACCMTVVDELEQGAEAERAVGEMLRQYCEHGMAQLGFACPSDPLPSRAAQQVVYLNVRALRPPSGLQTLRSEMTPAERHGTAMIELVSLYAMKLLGDQPNVPKIGGFDEAYVLASHITGRQMLERWARWARSLFGVPIFGTQNVQDLELYKNLIGVAFLGAMRSREDAAAALRARDLDEDGRLCRALCEQYGQTETTKGQFLLCDLHGRSEEIRFDPGARLLKAFSTTPEDELLAPSETDRKEASDVFLPSA